MRPIIAFTGTILAVYFALAALTRYEFIQNFRAIDNVIGMLPVVLIVFSVGAVLYLLWMRPKKAIAASLLAFTVLALALFPTSLRGNWWLNLTISDEAESKPDLAPFAPFSEHSQTAKLDGEATLKLAKNLNLDGATALYPLYAAFAESTYQPDNFSSDSVQCTNTRNAYNHLIAGERDIIFVASAAQSQIEAAKNAGADLRFTPIGYEAFVFLVGKQNPLENLSSVQIRNIYSGKTANWSTLGWKEGGKIIAFQRPEGSGSQTGLQNLMGDLPILSPQPLPDPSLIGSNSLMKQVSVQYLGVQPALGYSYRYYATTMYANPDTKLLSIDGIAPTAENIRNGAYPHIGQFYAVTNGEPTGEIKAFIDWILSEQGQELVAKTGYVPL